MKQYYLIIITLFTFGSVYAQQLPSTIGQVYNFEIGDSLQYYFNYYQNHNGQGYRGNNVIVITGKINSGDTTYYTYSNDVNFTWFSPPITPTYKPIPFIWLPNTATNFKVANRDSTIFTLNYNLTSCQSATESCDSVFYNSDYNDRKQTLHNDQGLSSLLVNFADSLGIVNYVYFDEVAPSTTVFNLLYYRKANGETWGNYELMVGIKETKNAIQLNVFPNPAKNTLYLTSEDATAKSVTVYATDGKIMGINSSMTTHAEMDITAFPSAIYYVEVLSKDGTGRYKFVKE